jgi:predicted ester cyclase
MDDGRTYWTRGRISRRTVLRGAGLGLAGLAGAALIGCGGGDEEGAMSLEENKAIARRWFDEVINGRRLDTIDTAYAPGYVHHFPGGREMDRAEGKAFAAAILEAFPDRVATVDDQVAEGDRVVTRFTSRGTQRGVFMGQPPTGKPNTTVGIVISRIEDGRIVEDWEIVDLASGAFREL